MKILITGIYGFLGRHLAERLADTHNVIGLYNTPRQVDFSRGIKCVNQLDLIEEAPDVIIMCHAAVASGNVLIEKEKLFDSNVDFTRQVVEKFSTAKMIFISSVSVFGSYNGIIDEKKAPSPESDYALSKLQGENEVLKNPNGSIVRFSSLYGNGMKENTLIPNYCNQALHSKVIQVWGDGARFQNYIHVDDAVNLIEKMIFHDKKIDFPVLGVSSKEYSNIEVAKIISDFTGSKISHLNEDKALSFYYNNELTQKVLNWQSETELKIGLKQYLEWKEKQF